MQRCGWGRRRRGWGIRTKYEDKCLCLWGRGRHAVQRGSGLGCCVYGKGVEVSAKREWVRMLCLWGGGRCESKEGVG